jgi:hypothetical protein
LLLSNEAFARIEKHDVTASAAIIPLSFMAIPPLYVYFITTAQLGQGKKQFLFVKNKHTKQKSLYKS